MSQQELICQGGIQVNQQVSVGGTGNESISARLPNGPKPQTIWAVDAASLTYSDTSQLDTFSASTSGIYLVPINNPTPDNVDTDTFLSMINRGVLLTNLIPDVVFSEGIGTSQFGQITMAISPVLVPAGYTLMAVLSNEAGTPIVGVVTLILNAQLRILQQQ